ncbi:hypothetical protein E2C01_071798 [Portunus trituberculatus]|uniref:Uncharacterized protein n=1 Tax=Portunus trituberculatus TaxID=210409 RepID=A0A5B7I605_PORTR|nr:hypothetical protein [Portunus trituberculatus]
MTTTTTITTTTITTTNHLKLVLSVLVCARNGVKCLCAFVLHHQPGLSGVQTGQSGVAHHQAAHITEACATQH